MVESSFYELKIVCYRSMHLASIYKCKFWCKTQLNLLIIQPMQNGSHAYTYVADCKWYTTQCNTEMCTLEMNATWF